MQFNKYIRKAKLLARGISSKIIFKLLYKNGFDQKQTLIICGSTRSGSTWLAEIVSASPGHSQIFEPLHTDYVNEAKKAGVTKNMYLKSDAPWPLGERFIESILTGKLINSWLASQIPLSKALKTKRLVVKFVRANMLLGWLGNNINSLPPALVIRHPCATISSQLSKGWAPSLDVLLSNSYFLEHPTLAQQCQKLTTKEERAALAWCIRYHAPLNLSSPKPFILICYEKLVRDGETELDHLFKQWKIPFTKETLDQLKKPSNTVTTTSQITQGRDPLAGWKKALTQEQTQRILNVVNLFGMDFYSDAVEPDYNRLYDRYGRAQQTNPVQTIKP